jgi:hypothetical protein
VSTIHSPCPSLHAFRLSLLGTDCLQQIKTHWPSLLESRRPKTVHAGCRRQNLMRCGKCTALSDRSNPRCKLLTLARQFGLLSPSTF